MLSCCEWSNLTFHNLTIFLKTERQRERERARETMFYVITLSITDVQRRWLGNELLVRSSEGITVTKEKCRTGRENCSSATLSTTNTIWTGLVVKPGLYGQRPAANRLSHGMTLNFKRTVKSLRVTADQSTASIGLRDFHVNLSGRVTLRMIPGFRRDVNEICTLWGF